MTTDRRNDASERPEVGAESRDRTVGANRRAVLLALSGAPVILTLTSNLAHAESAPGPSADPLYGCEPPRDDTKPSDPSECDDPPVEDE